MRLQTLLALCLLLLPGSASGQVTPIGLSEVRGRWLGNEDADPANDQFGASVAAGDFDADGYDDLAIGVPLHGTGAGPDAGGAAVLYGALFADGFEVGSTDRWPAVQP